MVLRLQMCHQACPFMCILPRFSTFKSPPLHPTTVEVLSTLQDVVEKRTVRAVAHHTKLRNGLGKIPGQAWKRKATLFTPLGFRKSITGGNRLQSGTTFVLSSEGHLTVEKEGEETTACPSPGALSGLQAPPLRLSQFMLTCFPLSRDASLAEEICSLQQGLACKLFKWVFLRNF